MFVSDTQYLSTVIYYYHSQLPAVLPQNIAARHRICTAIAAKVKELGYAGECGYNQILYPTEAHTRPLVNWILLKLPRAEVRE